MRRCGDASGTVWRLLDGVMLCVCAVAGYYNDRYIWPVGFRSTRSYNSYINVDDRVEYVSEILDGGDAGPIFRVTAKDDPENPAVSSAASSAWQAVSRNGQSEW